MTARSSYESSVLATAKTTPVTVINGSNVDAETARQEAINSVGVNSGANPQLGCTNSQIAAINAANQAKWAATYAAQVAKQAAIMVARDTLKATGDLGPT